MKKLMIVLAALSFMVVSFAKGPYLVLSMKDSSQRVYSLMSNPKMYNHDGSDIYIVKGENLYDAFNFFDVKEYTLNNYMLSYVLDGDTISSEIIAYATPLTAKAEPIKEGYIFSGWSEVPATMPANDVTITGSFEAIIKVDSIYLDLTELHLRVQESLQLTATILPVDALNKNVSWSSENSTIATVNNGLITAIAQGTTIIQVVTEDGGYAATCEVIVKDDTALYNVDAMPVKVYKTIENGTIYILRNGEKYTIDGRKVA